MGSLNHAETVVQQLDAALPGVISPAEPRYLEEPRGTFSGQAVFVAKPRTVAEVSEVLAICNAAQVGVIPYGGGTGLVGGQISAHGGLALLSLERMKAIRSCSKEDQTLVAEAGAILSDIHAAADAHDLIFPLSLASEGSCQIGGNLATNAGGVNVIRWGNTRELCLGIEAVLADGTVTHGLKSLRKDNTGYDLRNLLIGSEGTLGVITAARLRLFPKPVETVTALLDVETPADALGLLRTVERDFGELVSAFELIDATGVDFVKETLPTVKLPAVGPGKWKVLVEIGGGHGAAVQSRFEALLEHVFETERVVDGHVAQSEAQRQAIWNLRENIPLANREIGAIASHDISVPIGRLPQFIDDCREVVAQINPSLRINCFGHMGDGNLHYNVFPPEGKSKSDFLGLREDLSGAVHELVHAFDGSFSAEHGVGRLKTKDLEKYADPGKLALMKAIKTALDPNGIMNPGAVLG